MHSRNPLGMEELPKIAEGDGNFSWYSGALIICNVMQSGIWFLWGISCDLVKEQF